VKATHLDERLMLGSHAIRERARAKTRRDRRVSKSLAVGLAALAAAGASLAVFEGYRTRKVERDNPPLGHFIEVDGVRVHALDSRRYAGPAKANGLKPGRPVVLIHGNGVMVEDFVISGVVDRVAGAHRIICFDRPGFGHSERPRDRVWTPSAQASLLLAAFARLSAERPIVVGHSFGALVALAMALEYPESIAGLVLISGYYYPSARLDVPIFAPPAVPVLGDVLRHTVAPMIGRMVRPAVIRAMFSPRPTPERFKQDFPLAMMVRPSQIRAAAEDAAVMVPGAAEMEPFYRRLAMPALILAGAEDAIVSARDQPVRLNAELPQNELWVEPGIGHMLHHAAPDLVVDAIDRVDAWADPASRSDSLMQTGNEAALVETF
jgi:pimeloyl-ACP methyl ester carboxylesterase